MFSKLLDSAQTSSKPVERFIPPSRISPRPNSATGHGNRRLPGRDCGFDPHNHDPIEELASVPTAEPTHAPAVAVVAYRSRFGEPQELRFELHMLSFTHA